MPGVTEAGAKEQLNPSGKPEQLSPTALLKDPELGVTVTVSVPDAPELIVTDEGLVPKLRVALLLVEPAQLRVNLAAADI